MMKAKALVFLLSICFAGYYVHAQTANLVIFTQETEPFTLIMNGVRQNPSPETNVKITGLNAPNYKVKILFQNPALAEISKPVYIHPGTETTMEVLKNSKGLFVLRMMNRIPRDESRAPVAGQDICVYTVENGHPGSADRQEYSGPTGCQRPMSPHAFDDALESISSKTFASSKLAIAKEIAVSNCLRCKQVKEIMKLFTFESDRLEFAKFAYKHTWDVRNYFLLNDAFQFESSIDELNRFINRR